MSQNLELYNKSNKKTKGAKIKTVRGNQLLYPTPTTATTTANVGIITKQRSLPNFATNYNSDSSLSDYYPKDTITSESDNNHQNEKNIDEINLNNETARVISIDYPSEENIYDTVTTNVCEITSEGIYKNNNATTDESNVEDELYSKVNEKFGIESAVNNINKSEESNETPEDINKKFEESKDFILKPKNLIKTSIQVPGFDKVIDEYKTIVRVDSTTSSTSTLKDIEIKTHLDKCELKKHSHNYLKEFLESQKGSRKPLQNFLSKKFSRAFNNNKQTTNLIDNQYHSLPDINVSRNLQKCEKIDRKLRKCDTNRFIINIGSHFDVTSSSNCNIPVDFELKIAKIPKTTSNNNSDNRKPEIVGVKTKDNVTVMASKEFQQKIDSMRNYWSKITGENDKTGPEEIIENPTTKCKVVDLQEKKKDNIVQINKQLFEPKFELNKEVSNSFFRNPYFENQFQSLNPNIVEIIENGDTKVSESFSLTNNAQCDTKECNDTEKQEIAVCKKCEEKDCSKKVRSKKLRVFQSPEDEPQFDHIRYRVVKSDVFQKKIFANCEKESQFDGLMQYLQDYSFQELLIDNNIVIIEPIRSCVPYQNKSKKTTRNITSMLHKNDDNTKHGSLKRHFFYHPIRVNREVRDDELPNPDTVKQVRQFFEYGLKRSQSTDRLKEIRRNSLQYRNIDPDKDRCSASDSQPSSNFGSNDNFDTFYEPCCERQYVSEDILEKIRAYGTSVTYYGGRVLQKRIGDSNTSTRAIMEEIKDNEMKNNECKRCRNVQFSSETNDPNNSYQGIKFKLLKSNSCSSRLELVGTKNLTEYRNKYITKRNEINETTNKSKLNHINETIKNESPKIVGGETKKLIKKNLRDVIETNDNKIDNEINARNGDLLTKEDLNGASDDAQLKESIKSTGNDLNKIKLNYDYNDYKKLVKPRTIDDMEFEPYEIAGS